MAAKVMSILIRAAQLRVTNESVITGGAWRTHDFFSEIQNSLRLRYTTMSELDEYNPQELEDFAKSSALKIEQMEDAITEAGVSWIKTLFWVAKKANKVREATAAIIKTWKTEFDRRDSLASLFELHQKSAGEDSALAIDKFVRSEQAILQSLHGDGACDKLIESWIIAAKDAETAAAKVMDKRLNKLRRAREKIHAEGSNTEPTVDNLAELVKVVSRAEAATRAIEVAVAMAAYARADNYLPSNLKLSSLLQAREAALDATKKNTKKVVDEALHLTEQAVTSQVSEDDGHDLVVTSLKGAAIARLQSGFCREAYQLASNKVKKARQDVEEASMMVALIDSISSLSAEDLVEAKRNAESEKKRTIKALTEAQINADDAQKRAQAAAVEVAMVGSDTAQAVKCYLKAYAAPDNLRVASAVQILVEMEKHIRISRDSEGNTNAGFNLEALAATFAKCLGIDAAIIDGLVALARGDETSSTLTKFVDAMFKGGDNHRTVEILQVVLGLGRGDTQGLRCLAVNHLGMLKEDVDLVLADLSRFRPMATKTATVVRSGLSDLIAQHAWKTESLEELFSLADTDRNGTINFREYLEVVRTINYPNKVAEVSAMKDFVAADVDSTGLLDFAEFKAALRRNRKRRMENALSLLRLSPAEIGLAVFVLFVVVCLLLAFLLQGIAAFAIPGGFTAAVNSIWVVVGGAAAYFGQGAPVDAATHDEDQLDVVIKAADQSEIAKE